MKRRPSHHTFSLLVASLCALVALASCSTRKNTAATRNYNAFITRYNIYYNGDTHFRETLQKMEQDYEDDYSRLLFMHPVEAKADKEAPQPSGNFDRSIEKGRRPYSYAASRSARARSRARAATPHIRHGSSATSTTRSCTTHG